MARMEQENFSSVSWQSERHNEGTTSASEASATTNFDTSENDQPVQDEGQLDPATGLGDEVLECTVTHPLKENEGSKDVFVSYLITTYVSSSPNVCMLRW